MTTDDSEASNRPILRVNRTLSIPLDELEWQFTASGGPGGQHANTANTRVELRFEIASSPSLDSHQRERLVERLGPTLRVVVTTERSQLRNREIALERLARRLAEALIEVTPRVPTRRTRGSNERRLATKKRTSTTKRLRQRDIDD